MMIYGIYCVKIVWKSVSDRSVLSVGFGWVIRYTDSNKGWSAGIPITYKIRIVMISKNNNLYLWDLTDLSELLIVKNRMDFSSLTLLSKNKLGGYQPLILLCAPALLPIGKQQLFMN